MIATDATAKVIRKATKMEHYEIIARIKPGTKSTKEYRAEFADGTVTQWQTKKLHTYLDGYRVMAANGDAYAIQEVPRREAEYREQGWL